MPITLKMLKHTSILVDIRHIDEPLFDDCFFQIARLPMLSLPTKLIRLKIPIYKNNLIIIKLIIEISLITIITI